MKNNFAPRYRRSQKSEENKLETQSPMPKSFRMQNTLSHIAVAQEFQLAFLRKDGPLKKKVGNAML